VIHTAGYSFVCVTGHFSLCVLYFVESQIYCAHYSPTCY
jgi:hypothetical protein